MRNEKIYLELFANIGNYAYLGEQNVLTQDLACGSDNVENYLYLCSIKQNPTDELRQQFSSAYALETIIGQYTFGTPEGSVGPDGYSLDYYYVCQPGRAEMQNDLILDYRTNVALYPEFQQYLRTHI